jgi:hypothetical protein
MLRAVAVVLAVAFTSAAAWFLYQAFFVLDRFGLMAILLALALLLVAALWSWLAAEGSSLQVRRRSLHIFLGGVIGLASFTTVAAISSFRDSVEKVGLADIGFIAGFMYGPPGFVIGSYVGFMYSLFWLRGTNRLTNRSSEPPPVV